MCKMTNVPHLFRNQRENLFNFHFPHPPCLHRGVLLQQLLPGGHPFRSTLLDVHDMCDICVRQLSGCLSHYAFGGQINERQSEEVGNSSLQRWKWKGAPCPFFESLSTSERSQKWLTATTQGVPIVVARGLHFLYRRLFYVYVFVSQSRDWRSLSIDPVSRSQAQHSWSHTHARTHTNCQIQSNGNVL